MNIAVQRLLNQLLLQPQNDSPLDIVQWMGAMQAQDYSMFQWSIGVRIKKPDQASVIKALNDGTIIRMHLNRCTCQVVARQDVYWMLSLFGEKNKRTVLAWAASGGKPLTPDMQQTSRKLLFEALSGGHTFTVKQLAPLYAEAGISDIGIVRHLLTLAETEGLLCSGQTSGNLHGYTLLKERIPVSDPITKERALARLALLYFQSHAPATLEDFVWWTGLTKSECRTGMSMIAKDLTEFKFGDSIYFSHRNHIPGRYIENKVIFLPAYDELLLGYKNRTAVLNKEYENKAYNKFGIFYPVMLYGQQITGTWKRKTMTHELFCGIEPSAEILQEAKERLSAFRKTATPPFSSKAPLT